MTTREATKAYRLNQWTQVIRECRNSGQKVKDWCNDNDVDPKKYYYWLTQVRKAAIQSLPATLSDSTIVPIQTAQPEFTSSVSAYSNENVATISFENIVIQLSNHASSELIANTLKAIQNVR